MFEYSTLGETPPPPPRVCFGRDELIEKIVCLAETLTPIALIGAGGIGKTSIALTVLHHERIKKRFGDNRRFIRCDQFAASSVQFLARLSKVIGAGVENPEDLTPLRPFLSSREMIIVLDNAESILDPQGADAQEIYAAAEGLSEFRSICLCITSRISTVPQHCKRPTIPTLSMESACEIFYGIHDNGGRSDIISNLLGRLDFHALSIALLATTASHNMWDHDRLAREWDTQRVRVLRTDYNRSMAATIELSLASPTFRGLGPDARDLLGIIAFFPQGVDENNLDWLFPTISNRRDIFDKLCVLSLAYRNKGFTTMLAPLQEYFRPKDPCSSPLLCTTRKHYFRRLSARVDPVQSGFEEARWIVSEDVNVEHLLDVFTSVDANSVEVWTACTNFIKHLYSHKRRLIGLGPKIEGLPDNHPSKPRCLFELSRLLGSVGNSRERKRLLTHTLKIWRERGNKHEVAKTLRFLSGAKRQLHLYKEGIQDVKEASELYEQLGDVGGQVLALEQLARLLHGDGQLDEAEKAASHLITILPDEPRPYNLCRSHSLLGEIYRSKGDTEKAIDHFKTALDIASPFSWHSDVSRNHHYLAEIYSDQGRFGDANAHIEQAKLHSINNPYALGSATGQQARYWCMEGRYEDAKAECLRAIDVFGNLGVMKEVEGCRELLRHIEKRMEHSIVITPGGSDLDGELPTKILLLTPFNSPSVERGAQS